MRRAGEAVSKVDILDHVSNVPEAADPVPLDQVSGRISLRGVGFRYGNRAVIRGVDLDIAPGETGEVVVHLDEAGTWQVIVEGDGVDDVTAPLRVS